MNGRKIEFHFSSSQKETMQLLAEPKNKFDLFTIKYPKIEEFGNKQLSMMWLPGEISYDKDRQHFEELKDERIRHILKRIIGFFFTSDGIVFANLDENFTEEFKAPEMKYLFAAISAIESIHAKSYGFQLDSLITNVEEKQEIMDAIVNIPSIRKMAEFAIKYMDQSHPLVNRMVAFLCIEGIFFSSPFAFIFWIRKYMPKKFPGIVAANDFISRDENLHCEANAYVINLFAEEGQLDFKNAEKVFREATQIAIEFAEDTFPNDLLGMTAAMMITHIKFVANRWAQIIGLKRLYDEAQKTPFTFMDNIALTKKDNMFESQTLTDYQGAPNMEVHFDYSSAENF